MKKTDKIEDLGVSAMLQEKLDLLNRPQNNDKYSLRFVSFDEYFTLLNKPEAFRESDILTEVFMPSEYFSGKDEPKSFRELIYFINNNWYYWIYRMTDWQFGCEDLRLSYRLRAAMLEKSIEDIRARVGYILGSLIPAQFDTMDKITDLVERLAVSEKGRREQSQYHIGLVISSDCVDGKGSNGRAFWGDLNIEKLVSQKKNLLGAIVPLPLQKFTAEVVGLSSSNSKWSHPVFDFTGEAVYPEVNL